MTDVYKCRKPGTQCCASKTQIREVIEQKTGVVVSHGPSSPPLSTPQSYGGFIQRNDTAPQFRPHVPSSLQVYTPAPGECNILTRFDLTVTVCVVCLKRLFFLLCFEYIFLFEKNRNTHLKTVLI